MKVKQALTPGKLLMRCKCSHGVDLHNKPKNEFHVDGKWKALHQNGCRGANCRCLTFVERINKWEKVKRSGDVQSNTNA